MIIASVLVPLFSTLALGSSPGKVRPSEVVDVSPFSVDIVYIRCPRTDALVEIHGEVTIGGAVVERRRSLRGADLHDTLPDVTHFFGDFRGPCDLVYRDAGGAERVLFDCTSEATDSSACAAMDPAVDFDGRRVAFTVFRGQLQRPRISFGAQVLDPEAENDDRYPFDLPVTLLATTEAQLHIVNLEDDSVEVLPHAEGSFDTGPAWLASGRLAFTSDHQGVFQTQVIGTGQGRRSSQIFTIDPRTGIDRELVSHHALAGEQHPMQLRDGRIVVSTWQLFGALPFRTTNGSPGGFGTLQNFFHIHAQNPDGSHQEAIYGQHTASQPSGLGLPTHKAAHFLTQASDEELWVTDYYRANNFGLGEVLGFPLPERGQEGIGPDEAPALGDIYRPRGMRRLAEWTTSSDIMAQLMPEPELRHPAYTDALAFAGKLGHPAGLPEGQLLVAWGKGACGTVASSKVLGDDPPPLTSGSGLGAEMNLMTHLGRDNPGCDLGIYATTQIPSLHPSDLQQIVDHREWHELMPRPVLPYAAIHGVERPLEVEEAVLRAEPSEYLPQGTPYGLLGAASLVLRETRALLGHPFEGEHQWGLQGTDTVDYDDDEICGVRILAVPPNNDDRAHADIKAPTGERVVVLGELAIANLFVDEPVRDALDMPDSSFLLRMPADMPYLMQTVDCWGRTLNSDQTWQSLRPGEVKTCGGCHVHGKPGLEFADSLAAGPAYRPAFLGEGQVPLLTGLVDGEPQVEMEAGYGRQYEFERDVMPIFASRCVDCHGAAQAEAGLRLDIPGVEADSTWWCLVRDRAQQCVPESLRHVGSASALRRPQLSKYLRFMNARGSLLYWKAANARTDGREDLDFGPADGPAHDVDFGADHPNDITPQELGILARWIDTGAQAGPAMLQDTLPPSLSMVPEFSDSDGALIGLWVGAVDVGSGLDDDALQLCVIEDGICAQELKVESLAHGRQWVALDEPVDDDHQQFEWSARDGAGNQTKLRRSVARLRDFAANSDSSGETGEGDESGTEGEDASETGGSTGSGSAEASGGDTGNDESSGAGTGGGTEVTGDEDSGGGSSVADDEGCGCRETRGSGWRCFWALILWGTIGGMRRR